MPELPEVETVARTLSPLVCGRRIVSSLLLNPGTLSGSEPLSVLDGREIVSVSRRGKLVLIGLAPEKRKAEGVAVHLKMTGRLFVYPHAHEPEAHTRALFDLSDGNRLFFDDARKFGYLRIMTPESLASWPFWQKLGPEPLEIAGDEFVARLGARGGMIKAVLLDQSVIAGVGNIYADESLFRAGIAPARRASTLSGARLLRLHAALREVLLEAIDACGSSIRDYRTARGDAGAFQNAFRVYGRGGGSCVNCGTTLLTGRVAGRGTTWCPRCQPAGGR